MLKIERDSMFYRFSLYGFLKNLRFFEPFILLIFRSYGLSFFQIGLLYSIRDISTNLLEIPTGIISDSFGRKLAMVSSFISYLLAFLMLYVSNTFALLGIAMVLFAFGEAFRTGTHKALILEYLNIKGRSHQKVAYYGFTRSASQVGSAVNALIAGLLVFYTGNYRLMFLVAVIPYLMNLANLASYPKELDGTIPGVKLAEIPGRLKVVAGDFLRIFQDPAALKALLNSAGFSAFFESSKDYLQPILAAVALSLVAFQDLPETGREALLIGLVYFGIYLLSSLASQQASSVSGRFRNLATAVNVTFFGGPIALFLSGAGVASNLHLLAVIPFIIFFALNNLRRPMNIGLISDQIPTRIFASGLSAESQLTTLLSALIAPLLGFLADTLGLGSGIGLVGLLMLASYYFVRVN